jgi:single-stranded-DNA-specific exonuclease
VEPRRSKWEPYPSLSPEDVRRIQDALPDLRLTPIMAQLLANRGLTDPHDIQCFLEPVEVDKLPNPLLMVGMRPAVERIRRAINNNEKIIVYGDFDADGVTATALLTLALRYFGAHVEPYVPHRIYEGYGVNVSALNEIAGGGGRLVITVDCGISNKSEADEATRLGLDLIVTDHHHLPEELPDVICINPKQRVEGCEEFEFLAGVGVAYQLVRALLWLFKEEEPEKLRGKDLRRLRDDLLGLVAIGTVADVAPLRGANRSLVQYGLAALPRHSLPGLRTMLEFAHVNINGMDTERIGFIIGPRLNAAGRIDDARTAYELLMTYDVTEARRLAQHLEAHNRKRQGLMNAITDYAREMAKHLDEAELILLHSPNWPSDSANPLGVVGLVASKLVEEFGRPVLVLAPGQSEGEWRGSARSTPDFDIHYALGQVKDLLVQYGGHSAAAGLTVKGDHIDELRSRLCDLARDRVPNGQSEAQPVTKVDCEITLSDVNEATYQSIMRLSPFGAGNPTPLFAARNVRVLDAFAINDSPHLKLLVADHTNISRSPLEAIAFRKAHLLKVIDKNAKVDLLFHIERREWKGDVYLQLKVKEIRVLGDEQETADKNR